MSVKRPHDEVDATGDTETTKASGVGDNSLVVPPYDAANEPMPDSPVFREDFLVLECFVGQLINHLCEPIHRRKSVNNVVNGLKEEVGTRTQSQLPEQLCIALNGAMQAGKTATGNSILNENIGKEGDEGYSSTVEMDRQFYSYMREALPELTKNTRKSFADGLRGIVGGVKAHEHYKTMGMMPFLSYLQTEAKEIGDMFRDITTDSPKNFVAKAMSTVYAKSAKIKGKAGAVKQRLHFFQQEVTRTGGVWQQAHDLLYEAFVLLLKAHKTRVETAAGEFFERIERTFEMMCPDETEESEEEIALRKELSLRLETVEHQLNNEVKPKLLEILGIPEPEDSLFV
ncbi:hypothetical protein CBER1_00596 [Cercospora berteroae]|uniref:Uncharacterized protein n=1 Tax=Cercospora berteroae TaxID=357750 RepID=A0A2S6CBC6_9PEZI|nr:hypothetical protein CBER1_00596 [Cercospora berteroae]